jgi:hypothetical protein
LVLGHQSEPRTEPLLAPELLLQVTSRLALDHQRDLGVHPFDPQQVGSQLPMQMLAHLERQRTSLPVRRLRQRLVGPRLQRPQILLDLLFAGGNFFPVRLLQLDRLL